MFYYSNTLLYSNEFFCNIALDLEAQSGYGDSVCFGPLMYYFKEQRTVDSRN